MGTQLRALYRPDLIICEGRDDESFTLSILREIVPQFQLLNCFGADAFRDAILGLALIKRECALRSLVIIADAEDSATQTRATIERAIADAKLATIRHKVIIVPFEQEDGALEDFVLRDAAPENVIECIGAFIHSMAQLGIPIQTAGQRAKARLRSFLAVKHPKENPTYYFRDGHYPIGGANAMRLQTEILAVLAD